MVSMYRPYFACAYGCTAQTVHIVCAASYYTSFASVGIVIYLIRTRKGYRSLPEAINERYGSMATLAFGLAVLFRLYQEVWSNALVVAGFYGAEVPLPLTTLCLGMQHTSMLCMMNTLALTKIL